MDEQVNIPVLLLFSDGVTLAQFLGARMVMALAYFGFFLGKSGKNKSEVSEKTAASVKVNLKEELTQKTF